MNKKFLKILVCMFFIIVIVILVGADENLTDSFSDSNLPQEETQSNLESFSENIENVEYLPIEQIYGNFSEENLNNSEQNNNQIIFLGNKNNQTGQKEISNKSLNESGQEEVINKSGENGENNKSGEINETTSKEFNEPNETIQEINADVRGNFQKETGVFSSSTSVSSFEEEYITIDDINKQENNSEEDSSQKNNTEKTTHIYYNEGKKVIEIKTYKRIEIKKEEIETNEFDKRVIISSEEHVEEPLRVYIDLNTEAKENEIKIYWENENLEITNDVNFEVKYYDENNNGLIDRVSWIIPHLSEQTFNIIIEFEKTFESLNQILLNVIPPPGNVNNPITFNVSINYSGNVNCYLKINDSIPQEFSGDLSNYSLNLPNGYYSWVINCSDTSNGSIYNSSSGSFTVNEIFLVSEPDKIYLLDQNDNLAGDVDSLTINSLSTSSINIVIDRPNPYNNYTASQVIGTTRSLTLDKNIILGKGFYKIIVNFGEPSANHTVERNFSVAEIDFVFDNTNIEENQEKSIRVIVNSDIEKIEYLIVDFGAGEDNNVTFLNVSTNYFDQTFKNLYEQEGNYEILVNLKINGKFFVVNAGSFNVIKTKDTNPPDINLIYPGHNSIIYNDTITFEYSADDKFKIQNCTFRLYNVSGNSEVEFTNVRETFTSIKNDENIKINLVDFDEGEYEWEVECYDNSSNSDYDFNLFEVRYSGGPSSSSSLTSGQGISYENQEEVEEVTSTLNGFLINENNLGIKEKEALESMGVLTDLEYYKKRLVQIDQYFKENYKYISSEELRDQKTEEYLEEFENIKNSIPLNIEVLDDYEYVKNSVDTDLEEVIEDYLKSTNTIASNSLVRKLARLNTEIQQEISVSVKIKDVEIEYENSTKHFVLIVKTIDLKDENYDQILEVIPKEIAESADEITFLIDNQVIKEDPVFEILYEDLNENNEIVYYIEKSLDIKKFPKTETLLFEDSFKELNVGVTGFFAMDLSGGNPIYLALAVLLTLCVIFLFVFVLEKIRKQRWKREPNIVKVYDLLGQIGRNIKERDLERAREGYHELKKIYPVLPEKTKGYFYNKISGILLEIDKRDIFGLVREYEEAKRHWNKDDCVRIYKDIKKVYERLPEKYQKIIYERITKY